MTNEEIQLQLHWGPTVGWRCSKPSKDPSLGGEVIGTLITGLTKEEATLQAKELAKRNNITELTVERLCADEVTGTWDESVGRCVHVGESFKVQADA